MFLWTFTTVSHIINSNWTSSKTPVQPERDGALENDIVTHEMTHGVTNRMTGGGTGRCLQTTEAGGMGEGWSDTMAMYVSSCAFGLQLSFFNSNDQLERAKFGGNT